MRDVGWGLSNAFYLAALFGAVAVVMRLLIGASYIPGVTLTRLIGTYAALGLAGGTLTGVFRPLTRHLVGSAILGAIWGIFLELAIRVPFDRLVPFDAVFMSICSVGGAVLGVQLRRAWTRIDEKRRAGLL
jgi:hypothetical protein